MLIEASRPPVRANIKAIGSSTKYHQSSKAKPLTSIVGDCNQKLQQPAVTDLYFIFAIGIISSNLAERKPHPQHKLSVIVPCSQQPAASRHLLLGSSKVVIPKPKHKHPASNMANCSQQLVTIFFKALANHLQQSSQPQSMQVCMNNKQAIINLLCVSILSWCASTSLFSFLFFLIP